MDPTLSEGYFPSWGLHVEHDFSGDTAGPHTGGGWKLCHHITVSPWRSVDSMVRVLHDKSAEPHVALGGRAGVEKPVAIQLTKLNLAGRALAHPSGPQTNRANCVQLEICATPGRSVLRAMNLAATIDDDGEPDDLGDAGELFAIPLPHEYLRAAVEARRAGEPDAHVCMRAGGESELMTAFRDGVASWGQDTYDAIAALCCLIDHRVDIPRKVPRAFTRTDRYSGQGWVDMEGHTGHQFCPGNDHTDPTTAFDGARLIDTMRDLDH